MICKTVLRGAVKWNITKIPILDIFQRMQVRNYSIKNVCQFGLCFDVDGVLVRGGSVLAPTKPAIQLLVDRHGNFRVPVLFVTNSVSRDEAKAERLSSLLGVTVNPSQIVQAHSPLSLMTRYHGLSCLVLGQGNIRQLAHELGFRNVCTVEDIRQAMPELDVIDHARKLKTERSDVNAQKNLPKIEAVLCLNEPLFWESALQITTDVLTTRGDLAQGVTPGPQLPLLACNVDLQYMDRAHIPRYGNGAFLCCLEALYKRLTGSELQYDVLSGKPSELTFQYADHKLQQQATDLGMDMPLTTMYMIGDNPHVDIAGANLYQDFVTRGRHGLDAGAAPHVPSCRLLPASAHSPARSVTHVRSVLVRTGVSQANVHSRDPLASCHKDFQITPGYLRPSLEFDDVLCAVRDILEKEM